MSILGKVKRMLLSGKSSSDNTKHYYKTSPTCQIPKLSLIYEQYFGHKTNGSFVEVGAYDGESVSNTSCLADVGWTGHCIEPIPEYYAKCKERHAKNENITVSQFAIGSKKEKTQLNVGGVLSTIRKDVKDNFDKLGWAKGNFTGKTVTVDQLTLDEYLTEHAINPMFDLLSIDVEGYEWQVIRSFNIKKWKPRMVIIELHDQNDNYLFLREECNNIVHYFEDNDYRVIYKDFSNTIYVSKDFYPEFTFGQ